MSKSVIYLLVDDVWEYKIFSFFGVKDLSLSGNICKFFRDHWLKFIDKRQISVPKDVETIDEAMRVIEILYDRIVYTKEHPMVVVLKEGFHKVTSSCATSYGIMLHTTLNISLGNITFIGKGMKKFYFLYQQRNKFFIFFLK